MNEPWFVNGVSAAVVPVDDRGLHYGHGLFETMRLWCGEIPLWPRHRARLLRDAAVLGIVLDPPRIEHELCHALAHWPRDGVVKLIVTAGSGGAGYRGGTAPALSLLGYRPVPPPRASLRVRCCAHRLSHNPVLAGIKHLNRLDQVLAARELPPAGEGLLCDHLDNVVEGLSGNLFVKVATGWCTPTLIGSGVRGVMRELLLEEIFPALGIAVTERAIAPAELATAAAMLLCNAVRGAEPIAVLEAPNRTFDIAPAQAVRRELERRWPCFAS
ncbi:MAG TPA: aminodeoxychorismate lyase [Porticoccaceae bacterium]|nr:aminodeoxychorismate lyase [Porticoccaceae bacterium]